MLASGNRDASGRSLYNNGTRTLRILRHLTASAALVCGLAVAGCSYQLHSLLSNDETDQTGSDTRPDDPAADAADSSRPSEGDLAYARAAAAEVLANGGKDSSVPWQNPQTGASGNITPLATSYTEGGLPCRDFLASYVHGGSQDWLQGAACRTARRKMGSHAPKTPQSSADRAIIACKSHRFDVALRRRGSHPTLRAVGGRAGPKYGTESLGMRDPYEVLGVDRKASAADIKSAYRRLAKKLHPDANKNDPKAAAHFAELNAAHEILADADKRKAFDRGEIDAEGKPRFHGFEGFSGGAEIRAAALGGTRISKASALGRKDLRARPGEAAAVRGRPRAAAASRTS